MRKTLLSALVVSILLGTSSVSPAHAQETGMETVLTVSVSGYDAIKGDLQSIAQASGTPQLMMPFMMLGPQGPKGLDTTKPWGAVVQTDGQRFAIFAFVPVTDLKSLLEFQKALNPRAELPQPDADGVYEIEAQDRQLVLVQKGGWAFLADDRKTLASVQEDPVPLLGGLNESYTIAVRAVVKSVPESMRDQILMPLRLGLEMGKQPIPGETPEQAAIRKRTIARSEEQFNKLINETDSVLIGLAVDPQSKAVRLDMQITAIEGTASAGEYALMAEAKSDLTGFYLPEAALTVLFAGTMPDSDAAQLEDMVNTYGSKALADLDQQDLSDGERKLAKQVLGDLITVIRKTIQSKRMDAGLALLASADSLNFVAGGFCADTPTLEKLFKQMVHLAIAEDPGIEQAVTLNAETHQGVRLHTVSLPADELPTEDIPAMIVGDALTAAVGFGDQNVYLAVGPQSIDRLKQAIDQSQAAPGQSVPPARISLSANAIAYVVEGLGGADESGMVPQIVAALKQAGQNDHLTVATQAIPNGVQSRLELEAGVLKVIGAVVSAVMEQFGSGPGGFPGFGKKEAPRPPGQSPF